MCLPPFPPKPPPYLPFSRGLSRKPESLYYPTLDLSVKRANPLPIHLKQVPPPFLVEKINKPSISSKPPFPPLIICGVTQDTQLNA